MDRRLPWKAIDSRCTVVANLPQPVSLCCNVSVKSSTYLKVAVHVEEKILRLDITMGNTLTVQIRDAGEDLLEAALDLAGRHATALDGRIQVTAWAELHDLAPVLVLVLDEIDGLDDVHVMQRRRYAELRGEFLDILLL